MLRYALRRILWAVPTLVGVSLVVFLLTSLLPDPLRDLNEPLASLLARDPVTFGRLQEVRAARFLDLPRFLNVRPRDVRVRAAEDVAHVAAADAQATIAAHDLARLGGAALPHVLPHLDALPPFERGRVAVALAPIARRIGLGTPGELADPTGAAIFWTHFWEDRSLDFTTTASRRAVTRLARQTSEMRERDIVLVDTFALPELMRELVDNQDPTVKVRLLRLIARVTGRPQPPAPDDARAVERAESAARDWWYVHRTDYTPLDGAERITSSITETRYGKWIAEAATGRFGVSLRDGEPVLDKLRARTPVTLGLTLLAMAGSYLVAIPVAVLSAWRRGTPVDHLLAFLLFALYSLPTFWVAQILSRAGGTGAASVEHLALPAVALTLASLAGLSRYQRSAMLEVLSQDYVRTARAKGVPEWRVILVHALRNAMMPTVTLAGLQLPALIGGAFIVEEVFQIPGLGYESLRAVEARDASWLIATALIIALVTTIGLIVSDLAYGALDPRVREMLAERARTQGRRG